MSAKTASSPPSTPTVPGSSGDMAEGESGLARSGSAQAKKKPEDFIFGKLIGEGSYSTVFLAKEVSSGKEYAIKVLEKRHIVREKKTQYVMREKEVFSKLNHPFFVRLFFTFQDNDRLYFGLSYARRGELLDYIKKLGCFDEKCTRFYAAEIALALEHLHSLGIIHRDLKPENILLNDQMHIQITDFGSAKILNDTDDPANQEKQRRNSFVGTAQYVSPEMLTSKSTSYSSDLWALGCIVYQLLSGQLPFWGGHEYQIFQKITKLEYEIPDGFNATARDLVENLLVLDPTQRLGCKEKGGYSSLQSHPFFEDTNWADLPKCNPPDLLPYLPAKGENSENLWSNYNTTGLDEHTISRLIIGDDKKWISETDRKTKLDLQSRENSFHKFVEGNLILKQGLVDKRKGLFARRRMLLLTEGPHLYYVDPQAMVLKGEIPWSKSLRPEPKNFKIFFVHTPNRTYYLEDPSSSAHQWCKKIEEVWQHYYGEKT